MNYDPQSISRAYIRQQTDSRPIVHGLRSEPRFRVYAKVFATGTFWFSALITIVVAMGSLS